MLLYLIPWIMFSLVNFIEAPMLQSLLGDFFIFVVLIEFALSGIFALVGGLLADIVGRKRVVITGFVVLGIEYAGLSLFSGMRVSWYLYTVFDSVAWGMFAAVFFMTLWGDLAEESVKEKYYLLGGLPYLLAGFLSVLVKPYVQTIQTMAAFSFASFFLFLAVIPLIYAPETLPEKRIKERELREYIEKAKKAKEKHA
jgi:MFS family permease